MKRGEVWTVAGGPDYASKPRPAVILQDNAFDATASITLCPFTSQTVDALGRSVRLKRRFGRSAKGHTTSSGIEAMPVRSLTLARTGGCPLPSLGRERRGIDGHNKPLRPRAARHDNESCPVRVHIVIRMVRTGVVCLQNGAVTRSSRAVPQVKAHGDQPLITPIEQLPTIGPPSRIPSACRRHDHR